MENRYMSNGAVPFETRINGEEEEEEVIIQERYDRAVNDRWRADTRSLLKRKWKLGRARRASVYSEKW